MNRLSTIKEGVDTSFTLLPSNTFLTEWLGRNEFLKKLWNERNRILKLCIHNYCTPT